MFTCGKLPFGCWRKWPFIRTLPLEWRHKERDGVSNHQPHDCLLNRLFRCRSKKTSNLRVNGLCERNSPVTGEFPAQRDSNAEMFPFDDVIMTLHYHQRTQAITDLSYYDCLKNEILCIMGLYCFFVFFYNSINPLGTLFNEIDLTLLSWLYNSLRYKWKKYMNINSYSSKDVRE